MNGFWHWDLGNLTTWIIVTLTFVISSWKGSARAGRQFGRYEENFNALTRTVSDLTNRISEINMRGTQWSQLGAAKESELVKSNTVRLDTHDKLLAELAPKLSTAVADLDWIKHYIQKVDRANAK